jgi:hypothetical protein
VPFFLHWPKAGIDHGRDIDLLMAHIDVFPTLTELSGFFSERKHKLRPDPIFTFERGPIDGRSFAETIINDGNAAQVVRRSRTLFVHVQRGYLPPKWDRSVAMTERWRLVEGKELYDIQTDPGQQSDIASQHPEVVKQLREDYEQWWASLTPVFDDVVRFDLGGAENPTTLMSHDWLMPEGETSAWHHNHVRNNALINGPFMVNIVKAGRYRVTPMRWPEYVDQPSGITGVEVSFWIDDFGHISRWDTDPGQQVSSRDLWLPAGPASLTTTLTRQDGKTFGAYYVKIDYLSEGAVSE